MVKSRLDLNIHCNRCSVSQSCVVSQLSHEETEKMNALIKKMAIIDTGEHLYHQNDDMKNIFALFSGCCKEYSLDKEGNEKINNFYFPGDILALESISTKKHIFSTLALQKSQLCLIPCETLFLTMQESPMFLRQFTYMISQKIRHNNDIPITTNAKQRIAAFLINIFERLQVNEIPQEQICLSLPMSQFDIANYLGLAHETISRIFHLFQKNDLIKITHKKIDIINIHFLKSVAQNSEPFAKNNALI